MVRRLMVPTPHAAVEMSIVAIVIAHAGAMMLVAQHM